MKTTLKELAAKAGKAATGTTSFIANIGYVLATSMENRRKGLELHRQKLSAERMQLQLLESILLDEQRQIPERGQIVYGSESMLPPPSILSTQQTGVEKGDAINLSKGSYFGISLGGAVNERARLQLLANARYVTRFDAMGINAQLKYLSFIFGGGIRITPSIAIDDYLALSEEDRRKKIIKERKLRRSVRNKLRKIRFQARIKSYIARRRKDGEVFLRITDAKNGKMYFVDPEEIRTPVDKTSDEGNKIYQGIERDHSNFEDIIRYYLVDEMGKLKETVEAEDMVYGRTVVDESEQRGIPVIAGALESIVETNSFVKIRRKFHKLRASVVMVRKMSGSIEDIRTSVLAGKTTNLGGSRVNLEKSPEGGSVVTMNKDSDLDFKSPNLEAKDAVNDYEMFRAPVSMALGMSDLQVFGMVGQANHASLSLAEQTAVRAFEMEQLVELHDEIYEIINKLKDFLLDEYKGNKEDVEWEITFPNVHNYDKKANAERGSILVEKGRGLMSKTTFIREDGRDPDEEFILMEKESGKEISQAGEADSALQGAGARVRRDDAPQDKANTDTPRVNPQLSGGTPNGNGKSEQ